MNFVHSQKTFFNPTSSDTIKKRQADHQLTKDEYQLTFANDSAHAYDATFQRASTDVLASRKMFQATKKLKRFA